MWPLLGKDPVSSLQSLHCGLSGFLLIDHVFSRGVARVSNREGPALPFLDARALGPCSVKLSLRGIKWMRRGYLFCFSDESRGSPRPWACCTFFRPFPSPPDPALYSWVGSWRDCLHSSLPQGMRGQNPQKPCGPVTHTVGPFQGKRTQKRRAGSLSCHLKGKAARQRD